MASKEIVLEGHTYSLDELPNPDTPLVLREKAHLLGAIDLEALVDDLGRLGNCVRIAYHGVAGYTELQIEIQRIGYDVTKLCDKSAITVGKFKNSSATVLTSLKSTYEFLLDGFEDMALETLADVADTAKVMAIAAEELHRDFDNQAEKVIKALEHTERTQCTEDEKVKKMEEHKKKMEIEKARREVLQKEAAEAERKARELLEAANTKEEKAIADILNIKEEEKRRAAEKQRREDEERRREENTGWFRKLINAFTGTSRSSHTHTSDGAYAASVNASLRTNEEKARAAREEKMKHLEIMREQQRMRSEALAEFAEFSKRIQNIDSEKNQVQAAIGALQNAIRALKSLAAVMLQAATFWKQLQEHCNLLAKDEMQKYIKMAMEYPEEKRLKLWTTPGFKTKAVTYYAYWVALDTVSGIYMERIRLTQRELYTYIQEALRPDEAREKVKELAGEFLQDLELQQKMIAEKKEAQSKEIQDLKDQAKKAADEEAASKQACAANIDDGKQDKPQLQ